MPKTFRLSGVLALIACTTLAVAAPSVAADPPVGPAPVAPPVSPAAMALSIGAAPSANCSVAGDQPVLACSTHSDFVWPNPGTQPANIAKGLTQNALKQGAVGGAPSVAISSGGFLANLPSIAYVFGGLLLAGGGAALASGGSNSVSP